jgi:hypothetical protein
MRPYGDGQLVADGQKPADVIALLATQNEVKLEMWV